MFLPRSVQIRGTQSSHGVSERSKELPTPRFSSSHETEGEKPTKLEEALGSKVNKEVSSDSEEESEPVVAYSKLQRWPSQGEPVCVVCGRYGAYIVDRTDRDVCSLECKARHLLKMGLPLIPTPSADVKGATPSLMPRDEPDLRGWSYRDDPKGMTTDQVNRLRSKMKIKVDGEHCPRPISSLHDLGLPRKLLSNLEGAGYETLTPVQMQVIPAALYQRDLLICAATGSGKTLSFLLPTLLHLLRRQGGVAEEVRFPRGLILTPTRELAMQIEERAKQLMRGLPDMKTALVVGGMPVANQLHRLKSGVELIVCTPARLNDIIENHPQDIELADVEMFVVDEVDCMLSMGFEAQVRQIEEMLPPRRQNLMFSATIPPSIARIAKGLMQDPLTITVGEPGTPCEALRHTVIWVEETAKKKKLLAFFGDKRHFKPPVVVFVSSKMGCLLLADTINKSGIPAATAVVLHGDMAQEKRSEILREFLNNQHSVLVTTNVLGRGVDLMNVKQVFIFDMPSSLLDFIHQVGRAGHMTATGSATTGSAVTFINNSNKSLFLGFSELMRRMGVVLPPQLLTSPHLALQRERKERRAEGQGASSREGGQMASPLLKGALSQRKREAEGMAQPQRKQAKKLTGRARRY